jgi:phosphoribosylamine--glycine ligase
MGAFSPADNWNETLQAQFDRATMRPLLNALEKSGVTFRGLLFPGLMITPAGPRVLEFNCRFGDPETQAILPRLKTDLLLLLQAVLDGTLEDVSIEWDDRVAVTVVLASGGYPGNYETGKMITGLDSCSEQGGVHVFHAGTRLENGRLVTSGGRVLAVTGLAETVERAREAAYAAVSRIRFEGCHYRRDIALSAVAAKLSAR